MSRFARSRVYAAPSCDDRSIPRMAVSNASYAAAGSRDLRPRARNKYISGCSQCRCDSSTSRRARAGSTVAILQAMAGGSQSCPGSGRICLKTRFGFGGIVRGQAKGDVPEHPFDRISDHWVGIALAMARADGRSTRASRAAKLPRSAIGLSRQFVCETKALGEEAPWPFPFRPAHTIARPRSPSW